MDRLRYTFDKCMKSVGIGLNTSQYRQYHAGVVKNFMRTPEDSIITESFVLHNQAGHTEETAYTIYGVSAVDMRKMTATELEAFRNASMSWHKAIGMSHGSPSSLEEASSASTKQSITENALKSPADTPLSECKTAILQVQETCNRLEEKYDRVHDLLQELIRRTTHGRIIHSPWESSRQLKRSHEPDHADTALDGPAKKTLKTPSLKEHLREFLGSKEADFHSDEQEKAVRHGLQPSQDALVVLPTGSGKSLTFMLPAYLRNDKVIVIVVPLVALQNDLLARCTKVGIQASFWDARETAGSKIVIASAEHLSSKAYQTFILELYTSNKLYAIFVNEAHLVLLWQNFRDSMRCLRKYIRPKGVDTKVITLTATAPPTIERAIASSCGMQNPLIIRRATTRRNIAYNVRDIQRDHLFREVDSVLCAALQDVQGSSMDHKAIVYVHTRDECNLLTVTLGAMSPNIPCFKYHAGMTTEDRNASQKSWENSSDQLPHVMIATSAFGCGIDVPTVRIVIHAGRPRTLTEFLQESGRAGRDKRPARSIVLNHNLTKVSPDSADRFLFLQQPLSSSADVSSAEFHEGMFGETEGLKQDTDECRRWSLELFADGECDKRSCHTRKLEPCDFCTGMSKSDGNSEDKYKSQTGAPDTLDRTKSTRQSIPLDTAPHNTLSLSSAAASSHQNLATHSQNSSASASAEDICNGYSARLPNSACPICTVRKSQLVHHSDFKDERNWPCYKNRCLKCGLSSHSVKDCDMFPCREQNGCLACGFRLIAGAVIHSQGTYGKNHCPIKKLLSIAFQTWKSPEKRTRMCKGLPQVSKLSSPEEFNRWLRGSSETDVLQPPGMTIFAPWFFKQILRSPI